MAAITAALALLLTARAWTSPLTTMPGLSGDPQTFQWYLTWWPQALGSGWNPWWTDHVAAPLGVNLMWNASMPLVALALAPITKATSGILTYNVALILGFVTTATASLLLARRLFVRAGVQVTFAVALAFSPFMVAHGLGHPNLVWAGYLPLTISVLIDLAQGRTRTARAGAVLGVATAAQLLIGEEIIALTAICVAVLTVWLVSERAGRTTWGRLTSGVLRSQLWFWPLAGGPLAIQLLGPHPITSTLHDTARYSLDLVNLVVPTTVSLLALGRATGGEWTGGNVLESTGFLGLAALVALYAAVRDRALAHVRAATWCACACLAIAVGGHVQVADHPTAVPSLGAVLGWIPLVRHTLPVRLTLVIDAALLVLVCSLVDTGRQRTSGPLHAPSTGLVHGWVGLALLCMAPWPMYSTSVRPPVPDFFSSGQAGADFADSTVLALPLAQAPESSTAMVWHAASGQRWKMVDGYVVNELFASRLRSRREDLGPCPACYWFNGRPTSVAVVEPAEARAQLRRLHIDWVVVGPDGSGVVQTSVVGRVSTVLGAPTRTGGVLLWRTPTA